MKEIDWKNHAYYKFLKDLMENSEVKVGQFRISDKNRCSCFDTDCKIVENPTQCFVNSKKDGYCPIIHNSN